MSVLPTELRDASVPRRGPTFEEILAPVEPESFFGDYWETRYLFLERGDPRFYGGILRLEDVDRAIQVAQSCPEPTLTLGPPKGVDAVRVRKAASEISSDRIYQAVSEGYSLRLERIDDFWPPVAELAAVFARRLSARIRAVLYLTPVATQGVSAHYDNRDAFILQLHGAKRWHLGPARYELPGLVAGHLADRLPSQLIADDSSRLSESVVLRPGDLLYVPRGVYHRPVAEEDTSLHISVVVYPMSWADLLTRAVEVLAADRPELRSALPADLAAGSGGRPDLEATFGDVVRTFARRAPFREALRSLVLEHLESEPRPVEGPFAALARRTSRSTIVFPRRFP